MSLTYKEAGVDIDKQDNFLKAIRSSMKSTHGPEVIEDFGGFSGLFRFDTNNYKDPVLVSSTDGVGTKLKIASQAHMHEGVGVDLVAMVVNDLIVGGAHPLFFLDYFATGKLEVETAKTIIASIARGCKEAGCALVGGETAEMPGMYAPGEYDLAGFGVGVIDSDNIINGSRISNNDVIIGIHSSGLHSNGYSLVRKVLFDKAQMDVNAHVDELGCTLAEELLTPTRIYVKSVLNILRDFTIKGIVHITGGGFLDNIPRVLPKRSTAVIHKSSWGIPPIFRLIQDLGEVEEMEMFRTFNMGIGMVLFAPEKDADDILLRFKALKEEAKLIGHVEQRTKGREPVVFAE